MKKIIRRLALSFSMYSRLPMPTFDFKEDDMKYCLIGLPVVGIIIAAFICVIYKMMLMADVETLAVPLVIALIPLMVTGGFHIDGFMDTEDAIRSYQDRDKKLEILKDPHIGAFSVIALLRMILIFGAALITYLNRADFTSVVEFALCFVMSRCICAVSSIILEKAKKDGMLYAETKKADRTVLTILGIMLALTVAFALFLDCLKGAVITASFIISMLLYKGTVYREFGGVTGDTAGYFVVRAEMLAIVCLALLRIFESI